MIYDWDIDKIQKNKDEIFNFYIRATTINKVAANKLLNEIEVLNGIIADYYNINVDIEHDKSDYLDKSCLLLKDYYKELLEIPKDIMSDIDKAFLKFEMLDDKYDEIEIPRIKLRPKELVSLSHDFFNWLPTNDCLWKNSIRNFTDPENKLLKFRRYTNQDYRGVMNSVDFPSYTPYFLILRKYDISDLVTLNHELAHGVIGSIVKNRYDSIGEVEGWYFQYLTRVFLKEKNIIDEKIYNQLEYEDFGVNYDLYIGLMMFNICHSLKRAKKGINYKNISNIADKCMSNLFLSEDIVKDYLSISPNYITTYIYSYLLTQDLECLYEKDPEVSFYNFYRFLSLDLDINHENLRNNGFTFMDDDYKSLQKKIEKINRL